jgi:hypothetical protein
MCGCSVLAFSAEDALDEAARIIADLISCMDDWSRQNLSSVDRGIEWLKQADHPGLWLRASVRDMMENKTPRSGDT